MALELLGGPFPVTAGLEEPALYTDRPMWLDDFGLIGIFRNYAMGNYRIGVGQISGETYLRNNYFFRSLNLAYDLSRNSLLKIDFVTDTAYNFDPLVCSALDVIEDDWQWWDSFVKLRDRYLRAVWSFDLDGFVVQSSPLGGNGEEWTTEYGPLPGPQQRGGGLPTITLFEGSQLCFGFPGGAIVLYDYERRTEMGPWRTIGLANRGIWASRKYGVFISLHDTNGRGSQQEIRVWGNEVRPASVSVPVAVDPIERARQSTVQTRVLGAEGDPAFGQLVDWRLVDGPGKLVSKQSTTDNDGYAEVEYRGPILSLTSVTIEAGATF